MENEVYLKAKNGDMKAVEEILKNFEGLIVKQCRSYNLYGYAFEDLKQIAYSSVLEGLKKFDLKYISTAPAYIITCIKNSLRNEARKTLNKPDPDSLNNPNELGVEMIDTLESDYDMENDVINKINLSETMEEYEKLSSEEKDILSHYVMNPYGGLKEYSEKYHTNYRKVRYLKDCIIKKLQKSL